ncbi:MAG: cation:proton antiporter [Pseudomonadales bacterium]|nr:cation:proton antiporter [Pseudomonadales bacterium]
MEPLTIIAAFLAGLVVKRLGYPPLPGYLIAGFVSHGLGLGDITIISAVAEIGILLLLFTIGLKLDLRELMAPQVWAVGGLAIAITVPLTAAGLVAGAAMVPALSLDGPAATWSLALALSFSSTVFAVKMFEDRGETNSLHARIAIGILVIQDLIAVLYLVASSGVLPSPWAFALILLPLLRRPLIAILMAAGHGELVMLFGIAIALGTAEIFEAVHLEGGLGALLAGVILGSSPKSKELYSNLIGMKDLLLIGFFLQIGYYGLPSPAMGLVAMILVVVLLARPFIYHALFVLFRLRARTALLASLSLFSYSEFGLIVAAIATADGLIPVDWLTTLAVALSISFFLATPVNAQVHRLYSRLATVLHRYERKTRLVAEEAGRLGKADIVVLGMGRVGQGAYRHLFDQYGDRIVGVEENADKTLEHRENGINCIHGDANDFDFWMTADLARRKLILVSLTNHSENLGVVRLARQFGYGGILAVVSRYPDEREELEALGCISFNLYAEAGHGFAEHVMSRVSPD